MASRNNLLIFNYSEALVNVEHARHHYSEKFLLDAKAYVNLVQHLYGSFAIEAQKPERQDEEEIFMQRSLF